MVTLRQVFRPLLMGSITAVVTALLYLKSRDLEKQITELVKKQGYTPPGVDLLNPATWGNWQAQAQDALGDLWLSLQIGALWLELQVTVAAMYGTIVIGGAVTAYFVWLDLVRTPQEIATQAAMKERVATRTIEVAIPAAAAAANPASTPAQAAAVVGG